MLPRKVPVRVRVLGASPVVTTMGVAVVREGCKLTSLVYRVTTLIFRLFTVLVLVLLLLLSLPPIFRKSSQMDKTLPTRPRFTSAKEDRVSLSYGVYLGFKLTTVLTIGSSKEYPCRMGLGVLLFGTVTDLLVILLDE